MKTRIKQFLVGLIALTMLFQPALVVAGIPEAVAYLQGQVDDPWVTMALVAAGESNIPIGHLASVSGNLATDYAKTILAVAAVGENPVTFGNVDYVAQLKGYYDGTQIGNDNLLNDDMWAILALASVNEEDSIEAIVAKDFLLANQNPNGGWSYSVGAGSDTNDTAAAIMALIEMGLIPSSSVIDDAVNYLESAQNDDGGFGYSVGDDSDSGSGSWVISALIKAEIDPTTWTQGNNNPITHLESLQDDDGGFWWKPEGTSDWNNKAMTAYAVIALAGYSYPVGYYQGDSGPEPGTYQLRIEGQTNTICDTYVAATTALDIVENGAGTCGYTYNIEIMTFGPYLNQINDEMAEGMSGWMYFVNAVSPVIGAGDYVLEEGDEVLWYYGDWGWQPTRLTVSDNELDSGESITIEVEYFDGQNWLDLEGATIKGGDQDYLTDSSGQVTTVLPDGYHTLFAEKDSFVRSNSEVVLVGEGVSQNVGLTVEIDQGGRGNIAGESIIFEVSPSQLDFGTMKPDETNSQTVTLSNFGTVNLDIMAAVTGDVVFTQNLEIDDQVWSSYLTDLETYENKEAAVNLTVPTDYIGSGIKIGELIFWAQTQ